jgi:hypothetical protein
MKNVGSAQPWAIAERDLGPGVSDIVETFLGAFSFLT